MELDQGVFGHGYYDLEAIKQQLNDKAIIEVQHELDSILLGLRNRKRVLSMAKKIEVVSNMLSSRFKFRISLTHIDGGLFSTYVIPAKSGDVLLKTTDEVLSIYESIETIKDVNPDKFRKSNREIDSLLHDSYVSLGNILDTSKVKVDLNKATITGLPDDFTVIIMVDLDNAINNIGMTSRGVMGCILHEIGHTFSYVEQLARACQGSINLIDTIRDEYINGDMGLRDTLELTYRKNTNKKPKNMTNTELLVETAGSLLTLDDDNGYKDAEHLSDVFATRFGYGESVTMALISIGKFYGTTPKLFMSNFYAVILNIVSISVLLVTLTTLLVSMLNPLLFIITYPIGTIMISLVGRVMDSNDARVTFTEDASRYNSNDYDSTYDRVNRIKQQIISALKDTDLDNDTIRALVRQIDSVDRTLRGFKPNTTLVDRFRNMFSSSKERIDEKYIVEDLMNSQAVVSNARIAVMKKD